MWRHKTASDLSGGFFRGFKGVLAAVMKSDITFFSQVSE